MNSAACNWRVCFPGSGKDVTLGAAKGVSRTLACASDLRQWQHQIQHVPCTNCSPPRISSRWPSPAGKGCSHPTPCRPFTRPGTYPPALSTKVDKQTETRKETNKNTQQPTRPAKRDPPALRTTNPRTCLTGRQRQTDMTGQADKGSVGPRETGRAGRYGGWVLVSFPDPGGPPKAGGPGQPHFEALNGGGRQHSKRRALVRSQYGCTSAVLVAVAVPPRFGFGERDTY